MANAKSRGETDALVVVVLILVLLVLIGVGWLLYLQFQAASPETTTEAVGSQASDGEPAEGDFGRFRLLNAMKKKRVTALRVTRQVDDQQGTWEEITSALEPDQFTAVNPGAWFEGNFGDQGGLLSGVRGLRVEWRTEHAPNTWHSVEWNRNHPGFPSVKGVRYLILTVHSGLRGAGTAALVMASNHVLHAAPTEGLGRVEIANETPAALDHFALEVHDGNGWVAVQDRLVNGNAAEASSTGSNMFYTGQVSHHRADAATTLPFHEPGGVRVSYSLVGDNTNHSVTFSPGSAPFNGNPSNGDHEVQRISLRVFVDGNGQVASEGTLLMAKTRACYVQVGN